MSEIAFHPVIGVDGIPDGEGKAFAVAGRMIAVFKDGEEFHAIDDMCPHMGASLAPGYVEDGVVACPWHAWCFKISDGTWCDNPKVKIDSFPVRVRDGVVEVGISETSAETETPEDPQPTPGDSATSPDDTSFGKSSEAAED